MKGGGRSTQRAGVLSACLHSLATLSMYVFSSHHQTLISGIGRTGLPRRGVTCEDVQAIYFHYVYLLLAILCSNPQGNYKMIPLSEDLLFVDLLYDCLAENICICVYMYKIYIYVCILLVHTNYK